MITQIFMPHSTSRNTPKVIDTITISFPDEFVPPNIHIMNGPASLIYRDTGEVIDADDKLINYKREQKTILAVPGKLKTKPSGNMDIETIVRDGFVSFLHQGFTHFYWFSLNIYSDTEQEETHTHYDPRLIVRGYKHSTL